MNSLKELNEFVQAHIEGYTNGNDVIIDAATLARLMRHVKIVAYNIGINEGFTKAERAFNEAVETIENNKRDDRKS